MTINNLVIGLSLPKEIVEVVDLKRGDISRSKYVYRLLEKSLEVDTRDNGANNSGQEGSG